MTTDRFVQTERFVQFYNVVGNHPNIMGMPFNIMDRSDQLIEYLHNYINDQCSNPSEELINVMKQLEHRGRSLTANYQNVLKLTNRDVEHIKIEHMLSRVVENTITGDFQLLISVIHNKLNDGTMAYRVAPLRLFMGKDNKSWVKIEQLVEPLVGGGVNQKLFDIANLNVAVSQKPPPTKSYRLNLTNAQSSV